MGSPALPSDGAQDDAHLRETCLSTELVEQGKFLQWRRDRVQLPDGREAVREYVVHPGAVMIVAVLPDGRLVMERQFRYPVGMTMIEFPAGKLDPGEGGLACAQRELLEETGYRAQRWAKAGVMHPVIGYATEFIEIWLAEGLTLEERHLDEGEFLDVFAASQQELEDWMTQGRLTDAKTIVGMMWLQQWRAGAWQPDWQDVATTG
ncbi:MAG TPA: NUDIX hydrolase [Aquabacterium sp.]|jgi:ADP-ribose pyrophosphatase|uniref:NUDIX hydrolase n=1 Tax=Aquabacterium sp. TaxID=1872578 RepID=UPI002E349096|nr:NUDIX hydrolase [Aquabacterium sp.]HEX5357018.1 NUDIX hydrolase [Aquabacterium sp.]